MRINKNPKKQESVDLARQTFFNLKNREDLRHFVDKSSVFYKSQLNDNIDSLNASVLLVEDNWVQQKSIKELLWKS